jgi:hypothetical protein
LHLPNTILYSYDPGDHIFFCCFSLLVYVVQASRQLGGAQHIVLLDFPLVSVLVNIHGLDEIVYGKRYISTCPQYSLGASDVTFPSVSGRPKA